MNVLPFDSLEARGNLPRSQVHSGLGRPERCVIQLENEDGGRSTRTHSGVTTGVGVRAGRNRGVGVAGTRILVFATGRCAGRTGKTRRG